MKRMISILTVMILVCMMAASLAESGTTWLCVNCGRENREQANFCGGCGTARFVPAPTPEYCIFCGAELLSDDLFCTGCGRSRDAIDGWEEYTPRPVTVKIRDCADVNDRRYSHGGPSVYLYMETGGYHPYKVVSAKAWFAEGSSVLTEVTYQTVGKRLVYFTTNNFENRAAGVRQETLTGKQAILTANAIPYYGPGNDYEPYREKHVKLYAGDEVTGFFKVNGYVFCEFPSLDGRMTRGWILENQLQIR